MRRPCAEPCESRRESESCPERVESRPGVSVLLCSGLGCGVSEAVWGLTPRAANLNTVNGYSPHCTAYQHFIAYRDASSGAYWQPALSSEHAGRMRL